MAVVVKTDSSRSDTHSEADTFQVLQDGHLYVRKGDKSIAVYAPAGWRSATIIDK